MQPIITSLLDQDQYKFAMQNAVFRLFPDAQVEYRFINRGENAWPKNFLEELDEQILAFCELRFTEEEIYFLRVNCPYLSPTYLEWLQSYKPDPGEVYTGTHTEKGFTELFISGPWRRTILWEVPLMAMISELYFKMIDVPDPYYTDEGHRDIKKAQWLSEIAPYSDFGTRRRYSKANHSRIVRIHKEHGGENFQGTSNVALAMQYDLHPIGTMAHEWVMAHAAFYGYSVANATAMNNWYLTYNQRLSIALTDTYTTDRFFRDFDDRLAEQFDGLRQDSGSPEDFADRAIQFYSDSGVNPQKKKIVFSDGLNVARVASIHKHCAGRIQDSYGIGTNLTNDVGVKPLNMVIKMVRASLGRGKEMRDTVKLSDVYGKHTGKASAIEACRSELGL